MDVTRKTAAFAALCLFTVWMLATWLLEGRVETLLRPNAVTDRIIYIGVANILIGILGSALLLRLFVSADPAAMRLTGFGSVKRSALWVPIGIVAGLVLYSRQGAPSTDPVVVINAYAQVFVVSIAEVLVCWAVTASAIDRAIRGPIWLAVPLAALAASVLFGIYHFAHSPPFNTIGMVVFLTAIGLLTGTFFFLSKDVYATIVFHNFLGVIGVVQALAAKDQLAGLRSLQIPLIGTALTALSFLVLADIFIVRPRSA